VNPHRYRVFGRAIESEIPLDDLAPAPAGPAHWELRRGCSGPDEQPLELVGRHLVERWEYRLYRTPDGLRLMFAEQYVFDLSPDGRRIVWYPLPGALQENVRALVLGPVLALAQSLEGGFCLHGSAVATAEGGIAFLGSKYQGKSTLSLALTRAGARLLSDDCVAIDMGQELVVRPGVHSVRLWNDSAEMLRADQMRARLLRGVKNTLADLPTAMLQEAAVPLRAVYLLESVSPLHAEAAVARVPVPPALASVSVAYHTKIPQPLLGLDGTALQFQRAVALVRSVPVFRLRVVRDFTRLDAVARTLLAWHGSGTGDEVTGDSVGAGLASTFS
jgi:hypothetical protein